MVSFFVLILGHPSLAKFNQPKGIIGDSKNNLYISDPNNDVFRRIDGVSNFVSTFAIGFWGPEGSVWDNYGNIIISDNEA